MTNAWTKGPLLARRINSSKTHPFAVINPNGPFGDDVLAHYCSEADAQLFAAAPDMAEALEELAKAAEHDLATNKDDDSGPGGYWSPRTEIAIAAARAALAKARGAP